MTSDLKILQELVKKQATVSPKSTSYGKKIITLKENADGSQYAVTIQGLPKDAIAMKADMFPAPDHIFTCQRGECRRADYILITNSGQENFILYIEMKKGRAKSREIVTQLKGAQCLIAYCRAIGRLFWQKEDFLGAQYQSRFVSIREISLNKRPTRAQPEPPGNLNDTPERTLRIKGYDNLHFKKLILKARN